MITLDPHQLTALEKLSTGKILCGGVGSGKSRTAIAYYYLNDCQGGLKVNGRGSRAPMRAPKDLYVITTANKRDRLEWPKEAVAFGITDDPSLHPDGIKMVVDSWNNLKKYENVEGAFFVFDEQRLVGSGAWVKSFLKIAKQNNWILLSATPGDVWLDYLPVFQANGFYRTRSDFKLDHVVYQPYSKFPKVLRYVGTNKLVRLRDEILVDMPVEKHTTRNIEHVICEWDEDLTKETLKKRWNFWKDRPIKSTAELFYLLRRIANSDPSRLVRLEEVCAGHPRVIVFYNFDYELELLREFAGKREGTEVAEWNGHRHEPVPTSDKWIYLVQYTSGAEGWNCITTNCMVLFSQNYSYRLTEQSMGRIDRMNTQFVNLWYFVLRSHAPIDRAIHKALKAKKTFNERSMPL